MEGTLSSVFAVLNTELCCYSLLLPSVSCICIDFNTESYLQVSLVVTLFQWKWIIVERCPAEELGMSKAKFKCFSLIDYSIPIDPILMEYYCAHYEEQMCLWGYIQDFQLEA